MQYLIDPKHGFVYWCADSVLMLAPHLRREKPVGPFLPMRFAGRLSIVYHAPAPSDPRMPSHCKTVRITANLSVMISARADALRQCFRRYRMTAGSVREPESCTLGHGMLHLCIPGHLMLPT